MIRIGNDKTYLIRHLSSGKVARDVSLSHTARGLFFFVNTVEDWTVIKMDEMALRDPVSAVASALDELEKAGYLFLIEKSQVEQIVQVGGI